MAEKNPLRSDVSASDGATDLQNNLLAAVGQPPFPANFTLKTEVIPVVIAGVRPTSTSSQLAAISAFTDGNNDNRLCIDPIPAFIKNQQSNLFLGATGDYYYVNAGGAALGTLFTNLDPLYRTFWVSEVYCSNAATDAALQIATNAAVNIGVLLASTATIKQQAFNYPIPIPYGYKIVGAGTLNVSYSLFGWYK